MDESDLPREFPTSADEKAWLANEASLDQIRTFMRYEGTGSKRWLYARECLRQREAAAGQGGARWNLRIGIAALIATMAGVVLAVVLR